MDSGVGTWGPGAAGQTGARLAEAEPVLDLWGTVAGRVSEYLQAMGVQEPLHLERLAARVRHRLEQRAATPLEDPLEAAIEEAGGLLDDWLIQELGIEGDRDALFAARAAVLSGAVPNWAARFAGVSGESLAAAIHGASVRATPAPVPLAMDPTTIELFWHRVGRAIARFLRGVLGYLPPDSAGVQPPAGPSLAGSTHQGPRT